MVSILDELDDRCERRGVLMWDERCRGCGYVRGSPPHVDRPEHDDIPGIHGG